MTLLSTTPTRTQANLLAKSAMLLASGQARTRVRKSIHLVKFKILLFYKAARQ